jgi:hypothetical protein
MNTDAPYETSEELLTLTRQHGYNISPTQLARWHRAGLLPRPRQQPLKEARGTCSLYPIGTGKQLLLLCSLRTTERRFSHLAWHLWLAGYPVALQIIRTQLEYANQRLARWLRWFSDFKQAMHTQDAPEEVLDLIERYAQANLHTQPLRRIRKRIGREYFPTFLHILVKLATEPGDETIHTYDGDERLLDLRILALGLGMAKRFVQKKDALEYYLVQFLMPQLHWVFDRLQEIHWEHLMENTTDFDLLQSRDELRNGLRVRAGNKARNKEYQSHLPKDYPRWQINLQETFHSLPMADQALVLVVWVALRSSCASHGFSAEFLWSF